MLKTQICISRDSETQISTCMFISLQTFIHRLILWGSILLSFLWFALYGILKNLFWDMYYVPFVTMATVEFWSVCALSAIAALLPRYGCLFVCLLVCLLVRFSVQVVINQMPKWLPFYYSFVCIQISPPFD